MRLEHPSVDALARNHRECVGEESIGVHDIDRLATMHLLAVSRVIPIGEDERPPTPLHESVVSSIDDAPLHAVPQLSEGREDDAEVTSTLATRRLEQSIDVLQQDEWRVLRNQRITYLPLQDAFFPFDSLCPSTGYRVILTWESADQQSVVWDGRLVDGADILIDIYIFLAEVRTVAVKSVLTFPARFPLICPHGIPIRIGVLEADTESSNASEQFAYCLLHGVSYLFSS